MNETIERRKHPITWVLIADGKRAQVYQLRHTPHGMPMFGHHHPDIREEIRAELAPVPNAKWRAESASIYKFGNHLLGRAFSSVSRSRSSLEPRTDPREEVKESFMKNLAQRIEEAHANDSFDRLVLAAPPKMLGELKKHLSRSVNERLLASVDKDLTHCRPDQILGHFREIPQLSAAE